MIKLLLRILLVGAACIYGLALLASVSALKLGSDLCAQPGAALGNALSTRSS